jgi:ketosteroid isomerase-like protein
MSEENLAVFRAVRQAYNRRDAEGVVEHAHPDVEWRSAAETLLGGDQSVYRGHDGLRAMFRDVDEALTGIETGWDWVRDLGDRIVSTGFFRSSGVESGAETESPVSAVADFRDGKLLRVTTYFDRDAALRAAGLDETEPRGRSGKTVRRAFDAMNRRDFELLDSLITTDAAYHSPRTGTVYSGPDGVRALFRELDEAFASYDQTPERLIDAGDIVIADVRVAGVGVGSGAAGEQRIAFLFRLRDGKIWRGEGYFTVAEALDAAGLAADL